MSIVYTMSILLTMICILHTFFLIPVKYHHYQADHRLRSGIDGVISTAAGICAGCEAYPGGFQETTRLDNIYLMIHG